MSGVRRYPCALLALSLTYLPMSTHASPYLWRNVMVGGGGYSPNILLSPRVKGLAYLRTDIGGLYRFESTSSRWIPLQDGMAQSSYFGIESIALDPEDDEVIYAAVGMYRSDAAAILRSSDRGGHWIATPVTFRMGGNEDGRGMGERLAVDPNDHAILFFGSRHDGLQRSVDFGRSWSRVSTLPVDTSRADAHNGGVSFVLFDPRGSSTGQPSQRLYVGIANEGTATLWRSQDAGEHWQVLRAPVPSGLLPLRAALDANGDLFVTFADGIGPNGITRGAVWRFGTLDTESADVTPRIAAAEGGYLGLALDSIHPGTVLVASVDAWHSKDTVWRSTDRGVHWQSLRERAVMNIAATPFLDFGRPRAEFGWWMTGLAIDPFDSNHLVYTTGATVYASDSPLEGATPLQIAPWVSGIEETAVLSLAQSRSVLLSGFGDIGGFRHEDLEHSPPHMYQNPVFTNTDQIVVASGAQDRVVRSGRLHSEQIAAADSMDGGRTWNPVSLPSRLRSDCAENKHPRPPWLALSADASALIMAGCNAWVSADRGVHWREIQGLPAGAHPIADGRHSTRFYAYAQSQWWVSDDGRRFLKTASWGLPRVGNAADLNGRSGFSLYAVPGRRADLWLLVEGQAYHSVDGGMHFKHLLTDLRFEQLSFGKPASPAGYPTLFAMATRSSRRGIYRSNNCGVSFEGVTDEEHEYGGRYRVILADQMVVDRVYVGTDGRGLLVADRRR